MPCWSPWNLSHEKPSRNERERRFGSFESMIKFAWLMLNMLFLDVMIVVCWCLMMDIHDAMPNFHFWNVFILLGNRSWGLGFVLRAAQLPADLPATFIAPAPLPADSGLGIIMHGCATVHGQQPIGTFRSLAQNGSVPISGSWNYQTAIPHFNFKSFHFISSIISSNLQNS